MVSLSFNIITFLVLMVLPLLHVTQSASTADMSEVPASGDHETIKPVVVPRMGTLNLNQQETCEVSNRRFLGRKMMFKRILGMVKEEAGYLNGGQSSKSIATSSGSAHPVKNSININVRPQRLRNISRGHPHTRRRVKVKIAGNFIPLNADYHVPRPHPPKNN
ncbi:uncharacterized protein LOC121050479 [Rosa chinensis]|uniref:uncharacterized protein LOC121050479 n=1 Tax=Rosa chinensis TaxID=74649 RepID=UPI001AD8ABE4|nr:uncharacterized protein LOC121050479 [Rosa chinensis]